MPITVSAFPNLFEHASGENLGQFNLQDKCRFQQLGGKDTHSQGALTLFPRAELWRGGVGELGEVRCGPEWGCRQDISLVTDVHVAQEDGQVTQCLRGPCAQRGIQSVPINPAMSSQITFIN